jgi:phospholipid transport system substrate-binding protein
MCGKETGMKKVTLTCCLVLLVLAVLGAPPAAVAGPATEAVRKPINDGISLLRDQSVKTDAQRREQADRIWDILHRAFDFKLISALALGQNWRSFSPEERDAFADVFAKLLGNTYINKIQGEYSDEQVLFVGEEVFSQRKAVVKTVIKRQNQEIPVDYKVRFRGGEWKIYDVRVEGISLVLNYRHQFDTFLSKEKGTPDALIEKLKSKVAEKASPN